MGRVPSGMNREGQFGRRVPARRYAYCYDCSADTVQWLWAVETRSPGSYRGTRITAEYACSECGGVLHG